MVTRHDALFIGGEWVKPTGSDTISVTSPFTEELIGSVPAADEGDVDRAVAAARRAFDDPHGWSSWPPADRAAAMERLAAAIEKRAPAISAAVTAQNGMPIALSQAAEGGFPALVLRFYAEQVRSVEFEQSRTGLLGAGNVLVRREPVGVVAAIVPWNYPQTLAAFKYAAAMAMGCTVVMKASPETVLDSFLLADAIAEANLPAGVLNILPGGREVGAYLIAHPGVDKVAFTGSTASGKLVAATCAQLLRPVTLELGGKSAAIVLDDADLDLATIGESLFGATMLNNGQTCHNCTRILAPRSRYSEIVDTFTSFMAGLTIGDPMDPATQVGPLTGLAQRERVESYIAKGLGDGARITTGGGRPKAFDRGYFVEPTVFADVDNGHTIAQEEIFGPVLAVIPYDDTEDAIRLANDSDFGLGGSVWTSDPARGVEVARRIRTGTIGINSYLPDPAGPFGGVKGSGIGRELGSEGLAGYSTYKSIYVPF